METRKFISLSEANSLVNSAIKICHNADGEYMPLLRDFAIKYSVLVHCTDYPADQKSIDEIYEAVYSKDVSDELADIMYGSEQIQTLVAAVDESLQIEIEQMYRTNKVTKFLNDIIEMADGQINNPETIQAVKQALTEVTA